jgi:cytochrome b
MDLTLFNNAAPGHEPAGGSRMGVNMMHLLKMISVVGMLAALGWFFSTEEFAAVLLGIVSLSAFMMAFLPVKASNEV